MNQLCKLTVNCSPAADKCNSWQLTWRQKSSLPVKKLLTVSCLTQSSHSEFGPQRRRQGPVFLSVFQVPTTQETHELKLNIYTRILFIIIIIYFTLGSHIVLIKKHIFIVKEKGLFQPVWLKASSTYIPSKLTSWDMDWWAWNPFT